MTEPIDIFISYKREEYQRVDQLAGILREIGLNVWHDASLVSGDAWQIRIDERAHAFQKHCFIQDHKSDLAAQVFRAQLEHVYAHPWPHDP